MNALTSSSLLTAAALLLGSCDAGPPALDPGPADPCGFHEPALGSVDVSLRHDLFHADLYGRVEGLFLDGPLPGFHEVVAVEGACRHRKLVAGPCDPPCSGGELCAAGGQCIAYPNQIGAGTLTVDGLADALSVEPDAYFVGTYDGPGGLDASLFGAGDPVFAELAGDAFPAVSLGARGVAAMDTELTWTGLALPAGEDVTVSWTPGADPAACVALTLYGFNAVHGAPIADIVECVTSDTGAVVVPAALAAQLPTSGTPDVTSGFDWPHSELTRYTRQTVETDAGAARLTVDSTTYFQLLPAE